MLLRCVLFAAVLVQSLVAWAGGSGLNVVVVVNQSSTNSVQLGNDYCELRGVPPQNLLRITWTGGAVAWSRTDFETYLRQPLLEMLASSGLSNQVQYVVLCMDIPYRVEDGTSANSTTSTLFYGFKTNSVPPPGAPVTCSLPDYSSNSYAFSEMPLGSATPNTADTNSFLTFLLTDDTLAGAEAILRRALASDSSFPTQTVYLEKTSDAARNVRFFSFDNAVFDSRIHGHFDLVRIESDSTSFTNILGLQTGFAALGLPADAFVPGSIGDSLTSFGGDLFENTGQTPLLAFLNAGAAGSYGTVTEPCNYLQKFPDPLTYFYQRRGFSLAEAYYQSLLNPYEGVFVGEPLCAPFAQPGFSDWQSFTNGTLLSGRSVLPAALFSAAATNLPLGQIDLFIDGGFVRTLTNFPAFASNMISVTLNGIKIQYPVPAGATLASVTAGLGAALNQQSNVTRVAVFPTGDRLELQSLDLLTPGTNVLLSVGANSPDTLVLAPARPQFLDSIATGAHGITISNAPVQGDWLQLEVTQTNGSQVTLSVTNTTADTNIADLCQLLMNAINAQPALQGLDGIVASGLYPDLNFAQFFIYARSAGWAAAQLQTTLSASPDLVVLPPGAHTLEDNLSDLRPRNHLYLGAGLNQVPISFTLDTTQLADGFHELALVAYEGTSVRTQTRLERTVQIKNTSLSATLTPQLAGTNVALNTPLTIAVAANTNAIARIELFSTGGSIGVVSNQASALFTVPLGLLGLGLHPFYALVTDALGNQFRTQPVPIRTIPPFAITILTQPPALSWNTVAGLTYDVLSATNLGRPFKLAASLTASGATAQWALPLNTPATSFFRIQLDPANSASQPSSQIRP